MRLIGTINNPKDALRFGAFLTQEGIENQIELISNTDWGSTQYGDQEGKIWVVDEDQFSKARELLEQFHKDPLDPYFNKSKIAITPISAEEVEIEPEEIEKNEPANVLTLYFLITCILLFAATVMTAPNRDRIAVPYPYSAVHSGEVVQGLLFDFPRAYDIIDEIVDSYGVKGLQNPSNMPPEGQELLAQYNKTPYWEGYYDEAVLRLQEKPYQAWETQSTWFEKIRQGQIWRLFSPALLHGDIFHLLFNMVWLVVLGRQMEQRLKPFRYVLFILGVGIFANIAQYLMSGPDFLGFSGIVVGMFAFIWVRQQKAPWEGYQLQQSTIVLITIFVGAIFLIQVASFLAEVYTGSAMKLIVANTAHLAGAFAGFVLGRLNFFAWKR